MSCEFMSSAHAAASNSPLRPRSAALVAAAAREACSARSWLRATRRSVAGPMACASAIVAVNAPVAVASMPVTPVAATSAASESEAMVALKEVISYLQLFGTFAAVDDCPDCLSRGELRGPDVRGCFRRDNNVLWRMVKPQDAASRMQERFSAGRRQE